MSQSDTHLVWARRYAQDARDKGRKPRVHPNGFIQLDLVEATGDWNETKQKGHSGSSVRLHIWNPPGITLPHQDTINEIHDHVFDMESTVVRGKLTQRLYWFVIGSAHAHFEMYRAVYDQASSSRLAPMGIKGSLQLVEEFDVIEGDIYKQPAFTFHDTKVNDGETVVTIMRKAEVHDGEATVICPIESPPDNDFDRASAAPQDLLWDAIERSLDA